MLNYQRVSPGKRVAKEAGSCTDLSLDQKMEGGQQEGKRPESKDAGEQMTLVGCLFFI